MLKRAVRLLAFCAPASLALFLLAVVPRFGVLREGDRWNLVTARHWQLDRPEIARPRGSFVEGRYQGGS